MNPIADTAVTAVLIVAVVIITAIVCHVVNRNSQSSHVANLASLTASYKKDRDYWKAEYEHGLPFGDSGWIEMLDDSDASIDLLSVDLESPVKHRTLWMECDGEQELHYVGRTESPDLATYIGNLVIGELDPLMVGEVGEQAVRFEVRYMTAEEIQAIPVV